ncbi:MAG: glycosyltransferase [Actinobacteria bacterium]|nr:glycosyltransferase [Actinomycetota bacterium]
MKQSDSQLVSIVVNNYNYGRFLGEAVDSALGQTYPQVEVVVVDDGSTDDSREIIEAYGARIVTVLKENGGQGSAFNAGFGVCRGDIVIFLDADDVVLPDTAYRVVAAFDGRPELSKAQYRLELIDAAGAPTGKHDPPMFMSMPNGDLSRLALTFPDDIPHPPTSGNAFAAWALRRILPLPEEQYRVLADVYVLNLTLLLGPIVSLPETGGRYRVHGGNKHYTPTIELDRVRDLLRVTRDTHVHQQRLARSLELLPPGAVPEVSSLTFLARRLVSLKLDPGQHPIQGDRVAELSRRGIAAALRRPGLSPVLRALYVSWFAAMAAAPLPAARWLSERLFYPESRRGLARILTRLRPGGSG